MRLEKCGITRLVFIFDSVVIKIPNFTCQHDHFLQGCYSNYKERSYYKHWKNTNWSWKDMVAPVIFCSWFGLIQIQNRANILDRELTEQELLIFGNLTTDTKGNNFGYYKNKLVCVDFA